MKIFETIKQRQHRPALIIAGLMLVYFWFFSWPEIVPKLLGFSYGLHYLFHGGISRCLWGLFEILLVLTSVAIWVFSVFITWAAFCKSRKKAYVFILAYFLLPLVVQPTSRIIRHYVVAHQVQEYQTQQADYSSEFTDQEQVPMPIVMHAKRNINLPVGPLLLLAGMWYLYKKEEIKDDEPECARNALPRVRDT